MTFLDSSVVIGYLDDEPTVVAYVDEETSAPYFTSAVCVYEVLMGPVKSNEPTSLRDEREAFGWVRSLDLNESIALEANRIRDQLTDEGRQMPARGVLIAATARSTGDELVVADSVSPPIGSVHSSMSSNSPSEPRSYGPDQIGPRR